MQQTMAEIKQPALTDVELGLMPGRSSKVLMPQFLSARGITDPKRQEEIRVKIYLPNNDRLWEAKISLKSEMDRLIPTLHNRDIPLAIVTTSRESVVHRFIEKFKFGGFFQCVVSGEMVVNRKPDPEAFLRAAAELESLNITKADMLVIEDSAVGVTAAKAAGLTCVVIRNRHYPVIHFRRSRHGADYIFRSPKEILPLFGIDEYIAISRA